MFKPTVPQIKALREIAAGSAPGRWVAQHRRVLDAVRAKRWAAADGCDLILTPKGWHVLAALPDATAREKAVSAALRME